MGVGDREIRSAAWRVAMNSEADVLKNVKRNARPDLVAKGLDGQIYHLPFKPEGADPKLNDAIDIVVPLDSGDKIIPATVIHFDNDRSIDERAAGSFAAGLAAGGAALAKGISVTIRRNAKAARGWYGIAAFALAVGSTFGLGATNDVKTKREELQRQSRPLDR